MKDFNIIYGVISSYINKGVTTINLMDIAEFRHLDKHKQRNFVTWYLEFMHGKHGYKNLAIDSTTFVLTIL